MYKSEILEVGELVPEFKEEMLLVLFNETATPELRDMSVIHRVVRNESETPLKVGGTLIIGNRAYKIVQVGGDANANLQSLGHISVYFREEEKVLPGAISVEPHEFPEMNIGEFIEII